MSFSFCVLGSGSAGNSTVVICGSGSQTRCVLIDAGLSPRMTARRLAALGLQCEQITDILLTHLDTDHFCCGWVKALAKLQARVHIHRRHRAAAWRAGLTARETFLFTQALTLECGVQVDPMLLAHDDLGSVGYVLQHDGLRLGYATDIGHVPDALLDHFAQIDALAIESNYDRTMQLASERPWFLKRRIMGGNGHLSNDQAFDAVQQIAWANGGGLSQIALLHLSRQCNHPDLVRSLYRQHAPALESQLTITNQHAATAVMEVRRLERSLKGRSPTLMGQGVCGSQQQSPQLTLFSGVVMQGHRPAEAAPG